MIIIITYLGIAHLTTLVRLPLVTVFPSKTEILAFKLYLLFLSKLYLLLLAKLYLLLCI